MFAGREESQGAEVRRERKFGFGVGVGVEVRVVFLVVSFTFMFYISREGRRPIKGVLLCDKSLRHWYVLVRQLDL